MFWENVGLLIGVIGITAAMQARQPKVESLPVRVEARLQENHYDQQPEPGRHPHRHQPSEKNLPIH